MPRALTPHPPTTPPQLPPLPAAYSGDRIVCKQTNEQSDRLIWFKEPTPESIGAPLPPPTLQWPRPPPPAACGAGPNFLTGRVARPDPSSLRSGSLRHAGVA